MAAFDQRPVAFVVAFATLSFGLGVTAGACSSSSSPSTDGDGGSSTSSSGASSSGASSGGTSSSGGGDGSVSDGDSPDAATGCANGGAACTNGQQCCAGLPYPEEGVCANVCDSKSDRNAKEAFEDVDVEEILARVSRVPITRWSYREQPGARHIGPMAQDFHAAFSVGVDARTIHGVDGDGVALAAIQALDRHVRALERDVDALRKQNDALEKSCAGARETKR